MVRARPVPPRVLILSWEYPPIVEGGLARHVRKLAEQLVAQGTEVHVLPAVGVASRHTNRATASSFTGLASPTSRRTTSTPSSPGSTT